MGSTCGNGPNNDEVECSLSQSYEFSVHIGNYILSVTSAGISETCTIAGYPRAKKSCLIADEKIDKDMSDILPSNEDRLLLDVVQPLVDANNGRVYAEHSHCYKNDVRMLVDQGHMTVKSYDFERRIVPCP
jgi:hypothetical protein